jgi:hypothetical protein
MEATPIAQAFLKDRLVLQATDIAHVSKAGQGSNRL